MNEKAALLSIQPKWCGLIANGKKTVEVRKTKPTIETPFKVYIYCTNDRENLFWVGKRSPYVDERRHNVFDKNGNGRIIGEFVCDEIVEIYNCCDVHDELPGRPCEHYLDWDSDDDIPTMACLSYKELGYYIGKEGVGYAWHISELKIYNDQPKALSEFGAICDEDCPNCEFWKYVMVNQHERDMDCTNSSYPLRPLKRPPQSWRYVEVIK